MSENEISENQTVAETRIEADGPILTITIDRDHKRNSLTADVCASIADAVEKAPEREENRVIVIRGEGRAFCAGADLSGSHSNGDFHVQLKRMLNAIQDCPLVVIADVQGAAVGAGMQLSMAADLRVVGERGWFMIPPVKLGIAVDAWTIRRTRVLVGGARARTILLAAERVDLKEAVSCGLASFVGDSQKTLEVARNIASYAPLSLAYHKLVLNDDETNLDPKPEQQALYEQVWASEDAAEATKARAEKRDPVFRGK
ncbi:enoyl-CoA hydratase [Corynebacterium sp. H113]|uniref:enoyl-CoA hydratase n=1 Tax=Corynebacterium sp. H113 TaxID=3133419 RepID=UPI0030A8338F